MAGPTSPGADGPTTTPPHAPAGWIVQWDGSSRKYYFVKLRTGVSQWEMPVEADNTGTPGPEVSHPYGIPPPPEIITHPDGSQTIKHPDGRMEPILPPGDSERAGVDGPASDRGLGSVAINAILGGKHGNSNSNSSSHGSSALGAIASHFVVGGGGGGGGSHSHNGNGSSSGSFSGKPSAGKIVGAFAQSMFSSGNKPSAQPSHNYPGGQSDQGQGHHGGGLAGNIVGAIFGGGSKQSNSQGQGYGYSNSGGQSSYNAQTPPTQYQPPGPTPASQGGNASYYDPGAAANQSPQQHQPPQHHQPPQLHQQQFPITHPPLNSQPPYGPNLYPPAPASYGSSPQPPHDPSHGSQYPPAHYANSFAQPQYSPYPQGGPQQPPYAPQQHQQPADYYTAPVPHQQSYNRPTY